MTWESVERPGYFGARREVRYREFGEQFGPDKWRIVWYIGQRIGAFSEAVMLYEDAYFVWFAAHPDLAEWLVREASEVYDDAPSNIASGLDYAAQETQCTHIQDIAIRRCLARMGMVFAGPAPLRIRDRLSEHELGLLLSPGRVPFHRPEWICQPELEGWWSRGSVEAFYQSNKYLQVWRA
jgi:hypothetical protein